MKAQAIKLHIIQMYIERGKNDDQNKIQINIFIWYIMENANAIVSSVRPLEAATFFMGSCDDRDQSSRFDQPKKTER